MISYFQAPAPFNPALAAWAQLAAREFLRNQILKSSPTEDASKDSEENQDEEEDLEIADDKSE